MRVKSVSFGEVSDEVNDGFAFGTADGIAVHWMALILVLSGLHTKAKIPLLQVGPLGLLNAMNVEEQLLADGSTSP